MQATEQAQAIIDHAPTEGGSRYLARKAVGAYGIHFPKPGTIFVPMRDAAGTVRGGQWITDDGTKRFISGTRKQAALHLIGNFNPEGELWLCEGYATGATIFEAIGEPVAVAFDAGNLLPVANDLKALYPELRLAVAADNDQWKDPERNPGVHAARKVAWKYRARLAIPDFSHVDLGENQPTDWNDLARLIGQHKVKTQLLEAKVKVNPLDPLISGAQSTRDPLEIHSRSTRWQGCLLEWSSKGEQTRVIESQAGEIVADGLRDQLAWDSIGAYWLVWRGTHWQAQINSAEADKLIADLVTIGTGDKGFRPSYLNGITQLIQKRALLPIPEQPTSVVPFSNGVLDLATGELIPATPGRALDWSLPHAYDPQTDCPEIKAWLLRATDDDPETVELLRAWLAALVRGIPLQKFLLLLGRGGTGKGTFQRLAAALVGLSNTAISALRDLEENRFEGAKLVNKRLCMINEAGKHGGQLNMLKAITGGDHIPLERKHVQQSGSFIFDGLVLMASNENLQSTDSTSGLERRRLTVRFSRTATPKERADWEARGGEAQVLHPQIPGLINWLLALPVSEVRRRIEHPPARVVADNLLGMAAGNSVADWMMSNTLFDPQAKTQVGVKRERRGIEGVTNFENADQWLYPNYLTWCQEQGRSKPVSSRKFRDTLIDMAETLGHPVTHQQDTHTRSRVICGIRIATTAGESSSGDEWKGEPARVDQVIDFNRVSSGSSGSSGFLENSSQNFSQQTKTCGQCVFFEPPARAAGIGNCQQNIAAPWAEKPVPSKCNKFYRKTGR
jgi:putative DNA primase/helicase